MAAVSPYDFSLTGWYGSQGYKGGWPFIRESDGDLLVTFENKQPSPTCGVFGLDGDQLVIEANPASSSYARELVRSSSHLVWMAYRYVWPTGYGIRRNSPGSWTAGVIAGGAIPGSGYGPDFLFQNAILYAKDNGYYTGTDTLTWHAAPDDGTMRAPYCQLALAAGSVWVAHHWIEKPQGLPWIYHPTDQLAYKANLGDAWSATDHLLDETGEFEHCYGVGNAVFVNSIHSAGNYHHRLWRYDNGELSLEKEWLADPQNGDEKQRAICFKQAGTHVFQATRWRVYRRQVL